MSFLEILWEIAIYFSLISLLIFIFSMLTGLRIIKPKPKLRLHKKLSLIGFVLVTIHGLIMIYFYFFA
ncbi:MAG: hypothetical protein H6Q16_1394 [Bacteroidetes bacterium]|nr:hypothetical protein [Bacteroidota bacterium]